MIEVKSKPDKRNAGNIIWITLLVVGLFLFAFYGLSFFFSKPSVETITTHAPQFDANDQPLHNVKFQSNRKKN